MAKPADEQLAEFLGGTLIGLYVLGLIVAVYLLIKALELIARAVAAHPNNRYLLISLLVCLGLLVLAAVGGFNNQAADLLSAVAFALLVFVAKVVELYYDPYLQPHLSRELTVDQLLTEPWFNVG